MVKIIALLLVMVLINAFMVFAIIRAFKRTDELVRKYFLKKMGTLGYIVPETKIVPDQETTESPVTEGVVLPTNQSGAGNMTISAPTYMVSSTIENADYKNVDFKEEYKTLKNEMDFDKEQLVSNIIDNSKKDIADRLAKAAYDVDKSLPYDTIYELSSLSPEQQIEILKSSFDEDACDLLTSFIETQMVDEFDVLSFADYCKQLGQLYDPTYYVKTGWRTDNFDELDDHVVTLHDDDICEGIKVVHKNKLYDYSI